LKRAFVKSANTVLSVKFANGLSFSLHRHLQIMSKFRRRKLTVIFGLICNRHEKCAPMIMIWGLLRKLKRRFIFSET